MSIEDMTAPYAYGSRRGTPGRKPSLTNEQRNEVALRRQAGERAIDLAVEYGCSASAIRSCVAFDR